MIILENNLSVEIETWDDPGDYPSAARLIVLGVSFWIGRLPNVVIAKDIIHIPMNVKAVNAAPETTIDTSGEK